MIFSKYAKHVLIVHIGGIILFIANDNNKFIASDFLLCKSYEKTPIKDVFKLVSLQQLIVQIALC